MTGQLPPCAQDLPCGYDEDLDDCPCLDPDAPTELWDEPARRDITTVPTGSYL